MSIGRHHHIVVMGSLNRGSLVVGNPVVGRLVEAAEAGMRCTGERGRWPLGLGEEWGDERPGAGIL